MTEKRPMVAWNKSGTDYLQRTQGNLLGDVNVLYVDGGNGYMRRHIYQNIPNYALKMGASVIYKLHLNKVDVNHSILS